MRPDQIPNGRRNPTPGFDPCLVCHTLYGGSPRNAFGRDIEDHYLNFFGEVVWGPELAGLDSDGDGRSNGTELNDPNGLWREGQPQPGSPATVTNPGVAEAPPTPVSASSRPRLAALAALLALGAAAAGLRRRSSR